MRIVGSPCQKRATFVLNGLNFTVTSDHWMHITDSQGRQENVFSRKATEALLRAVMAGHFNSTPELHWFSISQEIYVEYHRKNDRKGGFPVFIHSGVGYRLKLGMAEFKQLVAKLKNLAINPAFTPKEQDFKSQQSRTRRWMQGKVLLREIDLLIDGLKSEINLTKNTEGKKMPDLLKVANFEVVDDLINMATSSFLVVMRPTCRRKRR